MDFASIIDIRSSFAPGKPATYPDKCFFISIAAVRSPYCFTARRRCFLIVGSFCLMDFGELVVFVVEVCVFFWRDWAISRRIHGFPAVARPIMSPSRVILPSGLVRRSRAFSTLSRSPFPITGIFRVFFAR